MGACLLLVMVYVLINALKESPAGPVVLIRTPVSGSQVSVGVLVEVQAVARDPKGVERIELWADGELVAVQKSQLASGSTPLPLLEGWIPRNTGQHTLIVRAYNIQHRKGQAAVILLAAEAQSGAGTPVYTAQAGDTLASIAENVQTSAEELGRLNPALGDPLQPGDSVVLPIPGEGVEGPPDSEYEMEAEPLPGEEAPTLPGLDFSGLLQYAPLWGGLLSARTSLVVEGLSLEVGKEYDGVYCYLSMAGSDVERIPAGLSFASLGGRKWDIAAETGGTNSRTVDIAAVSAHLDVMASCVGVSDTGDPFGGIAFDLGTLNASHPRAEWDGRVLEGTVMGMHGWFVVRYRIQPPSGGGGGGGGPIPPPYNLHAGSVWSLDGYWNGLFFEYPDDLMETVNGFGLYRNGALLYDVAHPRYDSSGTLPGYSTWFIPMWNHDYFPACPDSYDFYLTAFQNSDALRLESAASVQVSTVGDPIPCYQDKLVRVTFQQLHVWCLDVDDCYSPGLDTEGRALSDAAGNYIGCTTKCDPNYNAIPEGKFWVNGTRIMHLYQFVSSAHTYVFPDDFWQLHAGDNMASVFLGAHDSLTISMKWWDHEAMEPFNQPDSFCQGDFTIVPGELDDIARQALGRKKGYEQMFDHGNGNCTLSFQVEVVWNGE
jgi:LysM repeat protein